MTEENQNRANAQKKNKLEQILEAEKRIHELNRNVKPWVEGKTADDLIKEAKESRQLNDQQ